MGASARKQFNCRPDDETWLMIDECRRLGRDKLGIDVTDVQILKRAVGRLLYWTGGRCPTPRPWRRPQPAAEEPAQPAKAKKK